jgi:putative transposase
MSRLLRLVVPGLPHHITQRGNGGQKVFFSDADYEFYMALLADNCAVARVSCLAFALLPDRIHLILLPSTEDGLRAALAATVRHMLVAPVAAGLAKAPAKWPWSSAEALLKGVADGLTDVRALEARLDDIAGLLKSGTDLPVRDDETIGRPLGSNSFIAQIEKKTGRRPQPAKREPKTGRARIIR